jgi:DNA-binding Xre family transcriptional regulator
VAGALITQYSHGIRVDLDHLQALCEQLQTMPTDIAQATYAILIRLEGIK